MINRKVVSSLKANSSRSVPSVLHQPKYRRVNNVPSVAVGMTTAPVVSFLITHNLRTVPASSYTHVWAMVYFQTSAREV